MIVYIALDNDFFVLLFTNIIVVSHWTNIYQVIPPFPGSAAFLSLIFKFFNSSSFHIMSGFFSLYLHVLLFFSLELPLLFLAIFSSLGTRALSVSECISSPAALFSLFCLPLLLLFLLSGFLNFQPSGFFLTVRLLFSHL